jgi:hypothetical protein
MAIVDKPGDKLTVQLACGTGGSGWNGPATVRVASALNNAMPESRQIEAFFILPGSYHPLREGFTYDATEYHFGCSQTRSYTSMPCE